MKIDRDGMIESDVPDVDGATFRSMRRPAVDSDMSTLCAGDAAPSSAGLTMATWSGLVVVGVLALLSWQLA